MNRKSRPVVSREYKMMLRARQFRGGKRRVLAVAKQLKDDFAKAARPFTLRTDGEFEPVEVDKQVTVQFVDTTDLRLRSNDFVFRQRQPIGCRPLELPITPECDAEAKFLRVRRRVEVMSTDSRTPALADAAFVAHHFLTSPTRSRSKAVR